MKEDTRIELTEERVREIAREEYTKIREDEQKQKDALLKRMRGRLLR